MVKRLKITQVSSVLNQLVKKQGNRCAICGEKFTKKDKAVLDHDHDTGYIRGALHNSCNGAEGRVKNRAQLGHSGVKPYQYLVGLGKYLEKHQSPIIDLIHPTHKTEEEKRLERNAKARAARAKKNKR